jgi:hypothetical protein
MMPKIESRLAAITMSPVRARKMTTIGTTADAPAITQSMLGPCSAPCKALRFASTALVRGLRALTVPARRPPSWQLRDGRQCDDTSVAHFDRVVDVQSERR